MSTVSALTLSVSIVVLISYRSSAQPSNRNTTNTNRPQTPPYEVPYNIEDVAIPNPFAHIFLSGTLTFPMKKHTQYTCIVLISDSGQQNRNEQMYGHEPFWILADYLTRKGYAVLRYDDRGTEKSKGNYTTITLDDLTSDANAVVQYLKARNDIRKVGVLGHGEGASIGMKLVHDNPNNIGFLIFMAGCGTRGDSSFLLQTKLKEQKTGKTPAAIEYNLQLLRIATRIACENEKWAHGLAKIKTALFEKIRQDNPGKSDSIILVKEEAISQQFNPEFYTLIRLDPVQFLSRIYCPILALHGSNDMEISSKENLLSIREHTLQNHNVMVTEIENLNHLFQETNTGALNEYRYLSQTISPIAMQAISDWLHIFNF